MTHHQIYLLSLAGTVLIWVGGLWMLVAGVSYLLHIVRRHPVPTARTTNRAKRLLQHLLGEPDLPIAAAQRAVRMTAQFERFREWTRWAFRAPLFVVIVGEILHLASNELAIHRHEQVHTWRVVSNGVGLVGSVILAILIGRLLLAASPRLIIIRDVLATASLLGAVTEDRRGDHVDRLMRRFGRLERSVTSYYTLSHPAGDPYTRARLVGVSSGIYGLLIDAKQDLLFADSLTLMTTRQTLWMTAAAVAADPRALADAESAASTGRRPETARPRLIYRAGAVLTVLAVIAALIGLWWVDHSALSVVFSAIAAPLLVPAVIGLSRRGWSHNETARAKTADAGAVDGEPKSLGDIAIELSQKAGAGGEG